MVEFQCEYLPVSQSDGLGAMRLTTPLRLFSSSSSSPRPSRQKYTFGHFLEQRDTFLQSIGSERVQLPKKAKDVQSRLMNILHATGSKQEDSVTTSISPDAFSIDNFGPNMSATSARDLVTMKQMMACSVHLGHSRTKWNPKMAPFIFGERSGIHIIDLEKTMIALRQACNVVKDIASRGGGIVFVGTGDNIQRLTYECAQDCGQHYVNVRWIGGTITNRRQVLRDDKLAPDLIIILDPVENDKALLEAHSCGVPTIAICDTNCDPSKVTYPIPANDDAFSSVELIGRTLSLAATEGRSVHTNPLISADIIESATSFIDRVFTKRT